MIDFLIACICFTLAMIFLLTGIFTFIIVFAIILSILSWFVITIKKWFKKLKDLVVRR